MGDQEHLERLIHLQTAYWTFSPKEKAELLRLGDAATWPQSLRLHHLLCLEVAQYAQDYLRDASEPPPDRALYPAELTQQLARSVERLCSKGSPYRPRLGFVYQGPHQAGGDPTKSAIKQTGMLQNASLTHIGALEVIRLNGTEPTDLDFIPYDDVHRLEIGPTTVFSAARILFEDGDRMARWAKKSAKNLGGQRSVLWTSRGSKQVRQRAS